MGPPFHLIGAHVIQPPLRHSASSIHNERIAIVNRVLKTVPDMTVAGEKMARAIINDLKQLEVTPETAETFLARYSGNKRLRYERALEENNIFGLPHWAGKITMFVKNENLDPIAKRNPDPRAIQFRDPNYSAELALYLKPIEHMIYRLKVYGKNSGVGRVIAKGLNPTQRAQLINRKLNNLGPGACCVSIDGSRFDLHVNRKLLEAEHAFYLKYNRDPRFAELLRKQLYNCGSTRSGFKYEVEGGRMSGDMNTGLGNCVISYIMFKSLAKRMDVPMDLLVDGDDALIFISQEYLTNLNLLIAFHYLQFGMEMKIEEVAYRPEDVFWCQTRPITVSGDTWRMVRDPLRVLRTILVSKKWQVHRQKNYMASLALCEMSQNRGIPVLQAMALALWNNSSKNPDLCDSELREAVIGRALAMSSWDEIKRKGMDPQEISPESRISFQRAYGIDITTQILWEESLGHWTCEFGEPKHVGPVCNVGEWTATTDTPMGYEY
jgi:hypothetical protein